MELLEILQGKYKKFETEIVVKGRINVTYFEATVQEHLVYWIGSIVYLPSVADMASIISSEIDFK